MNKGLWAASLLLVLLGLFCVAAAVVLSAYKKDREKLSASVTAKVVDLVLMKNEGREGRNPTAMSGILCLSFTQMGSCIR